ncbi:MAG: sugar ABC transporter ATP-binding protein [Rhizobiales bacterium]|nr:sugar ABC transporter ATP-binding protein [Hyphomicrobiales bacterium]
MTSVAPFLRLAGISKRYPGVTALEDTHLEAYRGEAVALMGANGAGKSTLMNILGGVVSKDAGAILLDGSAVDIDSPRDAAVYGIAFVHQELNMLPSMTVAENVFANSYPMRGPLVDHERMVSLTRKVLGRLGCSFDAKDKVENLGTGDRQMVEIARALVRDPRVVIFDEPTSSLTDREKRRLFQIIDALKRDGVAIIYITHFLDEIFTVCERVAVMRNGRTVGMGVIGDFSTADVVQLMIGEAEVRERLAGPAAARAQPVLTAEGVTRRGVLHDISLDLYAGEVVGLWGLLGSGRTELVRALVGLDPMDAGTLRLRRAGELVSVTPAEIHRETGFVTEDRRGEGLLLPLSVEANLSLASLLQLLNPFRLIDRGKEGALAEDSIARLKVKVASRAQSVGTLSGGNQQKVVLGRWLATRPRLFFLDEPTRGLDVGAKAEILKLTVELAQAGATVLIISSELEEIMSVSDRYLLMSRGRIVGELPAAATREELMRGVSGEVAAEFAA